MKEIRLLMGMPITVEVVDGAADRASVGAAIGAVFDYFTYVDEKFSTYKDSSEISQINRRELDLVHASDDMKLIFALSELTRQETNGYFDIAYQGNYDPSGLVKGWAIFNAAGLLRQQGFQNFYVEAGGDIQADGQNADGEKWRIGIRNPFNTAQIVKALAVSNLGVATSGTYVRGPHIYNPKTSRPLVTDIVSLTVIGPNIYEADRFATAAFAMGRDGIKFIAGFADFEGYMIDSQGQATFTPGFEEYVINDQVH